MKPKRIALMNIESFSSGLAIQDLIKRERENIAVVINSTKPLQEGLMKSVIHNYRRSGFRFVVYLFLNFTAYYWMSSLRDGFDRIRGATRPPMRLSAVCRHYAIPYFEAPDVNAPATHEVLSSHDVDLILIYYFDQVLKQPTLSIPRSGVVNVHAALVPAFRGLFPVFRATQFGADPVGITAHEINDEKIDAGPILDRREIVTPAGLDALSRERFVNAGGVDLTCATLENFDALMKNRREQTGPGSYYSFPARADIAMFRRRGVKITSPFRFIAEIFWRKRL